MGQLEDHLGDGAKSGSQKQHWKATAAKNYNSQRTLHQYNKKNKKTGEVTKSNCREHLRAEGQHR